MTNLRTGKQFALPAIGSDVIEQFTFLNSTGSKFALVTVPFDSHGVRLNVPKGFRYFGDLIGDAPNRLTAFARDSGSTQFGPLGLVIGVSPVIVKNKALETGVDRYAVWAMRSPRIGRQTILLVDSISGPPTLALSQNGKQLAVCVPATVITAEAEKVTLKEICHGRFVNLIE